MDKSNRTVSAEVRSTSGVKISANSNISVRMSSSCFGWRSITTRSGQRTSARLSCQPGMTPVPRARSLSASNGIFPSSRPVASRRMPQGRSHCSGRSNNAAAIARSGMWNAANITWHGASVRCARSRVAGLRGGAGRNRPRSAARTGRGGGWRRARAGTAPAPPAGSRPFRKVA